MLQYVPYSMSINWFQAAHFYRKILKNKWKIIFIETFFVDVNLSAIKLRWFFADFDLRFYLCSSNKCCYTNCITDSLFCLEYNKISLGWISILRFNMRFFMILFALATATNGHFHKRSVSLSHRLSISCEIPIGRS